MAVTSTPTDRARVPRRRNGRDGADGQVLGALLVLGGIGWFVHQVGLVQLSVTTTLSCLLIVLGMGLVLTARRGGGVGLIALGVWLTIALASTTAVDASVLRRGAGERRFVPSTADQLEGRYQLGLGSLTLDLSELSAEELAGERVQVQIGVGELIVVLPPASEVAVDIRATARAGELDVLDRSPRDRSDGTNLIDTYRDPDAATGPHLELDLEVGLGTVQVVRPQSG